MQQKTSAEEQQIWVLTLQSETSFWFLMPHVPPHIHVIFCILHKYPVNRLSNRSLSKKVLFIKPLSWTSVCSCVTKCSATYLLFKYFREKFHNVKLAALYHTQLDNKAKMKQMNLNLYLFYSPFSQWLSSVLNQVFTDTKLPIWLKNSQLNHRWDIHI